MSPLVISIEVTKDDDRAQIAMYQYCGWTTGMCIMPLIFWAVGDWVWFVVLTSLPFGLLSLYTKYMIESPMWLATQGKLQKCSQQLNKIAKINGKNLEITEDMLKEKLKDSKNEETYGITSIFTNWRLAKNTILLVILMSSINLIFYVLTLNSMRIGGNPFLNFLYQAIVEFPSYFVGKWIIDRIGRRCTNVFCFLGAAMLSASVINLLDSTDYNIMVTVLTVFAKFIGGITFFSLNVQSMEIFPTCLRQTGIGICAVMTAVLGVIGPYIVYLGTEFDMKYPYIVICEYFENFKTNSNYIVSSDTLLNWLHLRNVSPRDFISQTSQYSSRRPRIWKESKVLVTTQQTDPQTRRGN